MRLLIFNPENDLALASNDPHYTPPASARQMAADLHDLPRLWAEEGDIIVQTQALPVSSQHGRKRLPSTDAEICGCPIHSTPSLARPEETFDPSRTFNFQLSTRTCSLDPSKSFNFQLLPWGWSPLLVRQLRERGIPEALLPTNEQLAAYRDFSSRETAVRLLQQLRTEWPKLFQSKTLVGESSWCTSEAEVHRTINDDGGTAMLKAPWSGSGRGVHPVHERPLPQQTLLWVRRTLQMQGGVEVEPLYNKVQDFAMEFWAEGGKVRYEGLSLFETTAGGVYAGNLVATEQEKEARLAAYLSPTLLHDVGTHLTSLLNEAGLPTWYTGPLGIDMMIVNPLNTHLATLPLQLHPLVELNLRMTMGWVALQLTSPDEGTGTFSITQQGGHYQALLNGKPAP